MPERDTDNNRSWVIPAVFPGGDYRLNQAAVAQPQLVEAIGVDGRFVGAIRPFPGMADDTVHGVPRPEAGNTITSIANVFFAKYASVQKGLTSDKLSGIVLLGDNQEDPATGKAIYFSYWDTSDDSHDVVMLEDFKDWDDFTLDTFAEYDVTSLGQYIYFVASGATTSVDSNYNTKQPPYNKAYYFDWQINEWDTSTDAWAGRLMSIAAPRFLRYPLNRDVHQLILQGLNAGVGAPNDKVGLIGDSPDYGLMDVGDLIHLQCGTDDAEQAVTVIDAPGHALTVGAVWGWTGAPVSWRLTDKDSVDGDVTFSASEVALTGFTLPVGYYTFGVELVSRKHKLRSYLRLNTVHASGNADKELQYTVEYYKAPSPTDGAADPSQLYDKRGVGAGEDSTHILNWGIPHMDGWRFWRSPGDGAASTVDRDKYTPVGMLYLVDEYLTKGMLDTGGPQGATGLTSHFDHASVGLGNHPALRRTTFYSDGVDSAEVESSGALQARPSYNSWDEPFGAAPRMKRLVAYSGLLVGITDPDTPTDFDTWDEMESRPEEVCWSHTSRDEPENFPVFNRYGLSAAGETFLGFESAGDHLFALTAGSVHKVLRSGSVISLNQVLSKIGVVSRQAATGVGNTLFVVTKAGVKSIDGNSGAVKSISALDRIIIDSDQWKGSLNDVHLEYDAAIGALVLLNTTKKECVFLWESTGAVTKVVDIPWSFLAGGPDVATSGTHRVYFIMSNGEVHIVDADREMGKRSMCGMGAAETANGTCTTGSATQIIDTEAAFPTNCLGHKVYILNGADEGVATTITTRDSGTVLTVSGLTELTDTDTRYAVAPIVTELVFPQLTGYRNEHDPFTRKITKSMSAAFSDLGGETTSSHVNPKLRFGVWRDGSRLQETEADIDILPDKCLARVNIGDARVYPSLRFLSGNIDFELQALMVEGIISGNVAQSRIT